MMSKGDLRIRFRDAIRARFAVEGEPLVFDRLLDDLAAIAIEHADERARSVARPAATLTPLSTAHPPRTGTQS